MTIFKCSICNNDDGLRMIANIEAVANCNEKGEFVNWHDLTESIGRPKFEKPSYCSRCGSEDIEELIAGKDYIDHNKLAGTFGVNTDDKEDSYNDEELNPWHNGGPND